MPWLQDHPVWWPVWWVLRVAGSVAQSAECWEGWPQWDGPGGGSEPPVIPTLSAGTGHHGWSEATRHMLTHTHCKNIHTDGLVHERRNSSALAMELCLPCINLSIQSYMYTVCPLWHAHGFVVLCFVVVISMAYWKTMVYPLLMHWENHNLVTALQSHTDISMAYCKHALTPVC